MRRVRERGEGMGERGYLLPSRLRGLEERRKLPQLFVHFELEKTNMVMTNLVFLSFYSEYLESNLQG